MKRMISKSNRALAATLVMTLAAMLAAAQAPKPSSKGLVIKGKAPISKEVLKVKLPKAYETKLSNGLQVIVLEQHKLPTFNMQMIVLSGGLTDAQLPSGGRERATPGERRDGPDALATIVSQLEGYEAPAIAWEADLLPALRWDRSDRLRLARF